MTRLAGIIDINMAQARLTEFYGARKRPSDLQPSKRRKVQCLGETGLVSTILPSDAITVPENLTDCTKAAPKTRSLRSQKSLNVQQTTTKLQTRRTTRAGKGSKKAAASSSNLKGKDLFEKCRSILKADNTEGDILEEATAIKDDHNGSPMGTPTKRTAKPEETTTSKRGRRAKTLQKDLLKEIDQKTPEKAYDFSEFTQEKKAQKSARKKLVLKKTTSSPTEKTKEEEPSVDLVKDADSVPSEVPDIPSTPVSRTKKDAVPSTKTPLKDKVKETLQNVKKAQAAPSKKAPSEGTSEKQINLSKFKNLDPAEMKAKLAKSGKLSELQARLAKVSETAARIKRDSPALLEEPKEEVKEEPKESTEKAPAYERFHHLAEKAAPTLSLPYKYKLLSEMFRGMDTVCSMLHNRSEIITFTKLKGAVQEMVRKNFEKKTLGQIKTVYPSGYSMRQEKGLPAFGKKTTDYQLTVEPNLSAATSKMTNKTGQQVMDVKQLLERRSVFHNSLISKVKQHHQTFLASLSRPLKIEDSKITRWHPSFPLDEVPDVEPAELPEPPYVKKFSSAKDVLAQATNIKDTKVQKALQNVAEKSQTESDDNSVKVVSGKTAGVAEAPKPAAVAKGVPMSLLERIRAKEAANLVNKITISSEDEKKAAMFARLPELCRILRTFFITEKKPALLMKDVTKKLHESYKSGISEVDVLPHVEMINKLVPGWLTILTVSKGTFIKMDRNKELNDVLEIIKKAQKA